MRKRIELSFIHIAAKGYNLIKTTRVPRARDSKQPAANHQPEVCA